MRVIDCDCGETIKAGNDDDLAEALKEHFQDRHPDRDADDAQVRELIGKRAYQATDA